MPRNKGNSVGLGLGGNMQDSAQKLAAAIRAIEAKHIGAVLAISSLWRTAPWGYEEQPSFLNACAMIETEMPPQKLLAALKMLERELGRTDALRWRPRLLDIDILFYNDLKLADENLTLPHKHLLERAFVLAPLAEIAPDVSIHGTTIQAAFTAINCAGVSIEAAGDGWARIAR